MAGHRFHPTLLREYDIRGIVGETLFEADAHAIGRGFGTIIRRNGGNRIAVGYDGRLSSPSLEASMIEGLSSTGIEVTRIGCGPTPMLYFAVHYLGTDGGLQITGSHNPPTHNGFKMMAGGRSFFGEQIKELGRIVEQDTLEVGAGAVHEADLFESYIERLLSDFHGRRPVDAVWDAGNGAAGPAMKALASRLPGRHVCLFDDIDGRFPNHHPDPTMPKNLEYLIQKVREGGFEVGFGFDGDGDRIGVVDAKGRIIWGDQIIQFLAADVLERHPGATIIADVKSSQQLFYAIEGFGGRPLMWKTGHSLIKDKMIETEAPLSGEMSGHIFYKDGFYGHDDALYVAIRFLDILARGTTTLSEWRDRLPEAFNTPEIRFDCPDEAKFALMAQIAANLADDGIDVDTTDGVRVASPEGWWLLRASNTQAVLVARAEANSEQSLAKLKREIVGQLARVGVEAPVF